MKSKLYQPYQGDNGLWEFTTAIGLCCNILTRADAVREAGITERADRASAALGQGALAMAIRKGLAAEEVES